MGGFLRAVLILVLFLSVKGMRSCQENRRNGSSGGLRFSPSSPYPIGGNYSTGGGGRIIYGGGSSGGVGERSSSRQTRDHSYVDGHWRTSPSGQRTYVKGHWRRRSKDLPRRP